MKKIKKIILSVIVAIISLVSIFSCVKGKYTPEPILSPVNVLKPANSVNDNVIRPTGTYDYIYFNTSYDFSDIDYYKNLSYPVVINREITGYDYDMKFLPIYVNAVEGTLFSIVMSYYNENRYLLSLSIDYIQTMQNVAIFFDTLNAVYNWRNFQNPYEYSLSNGVSSFEYMGVTYDVGTQNHLLTNIISPIPFLFEGDINYVQSSTGFEDVTQVESLYINTNYTNETLKTLIDEKVGYNDISFSLSDNNTTHTIRINNTTYECYIYLNNNYIYIYNYNETQYDIYWYGYGPTGVDNNLLLFNVDLYSLSGWNNDLNFLFSETNNFGAAAPTYEEGYADGYQQGYDNGYSSGVNNVTSNPNDYKLYTYNQYQGNYTNGYNAGEEDGYNRGYLDGLDDGSDTNISFQYIESVLTLIGNFLNIEVLPGIKLSYALGVVIILTIISIIKMVVK